MKEVKIDRDLLQKIIQTNREQHKGQFEKAFAGYRVACIKALEENLAAFKGNKLQRIAIYEQPPEEHTKDYDRVLKMIAMSVDDHITLTAQEFGQYVLDDWNWKESWTVSNSKYM